MKLNLRDLANLESGPVTPENATYGQILRAIVRVRQAGYVPAGVRLRSRVDATLFTADFPAELLETMRLDRGVASVEISEPLQQID